MDIAVPSELEHVLIAEAQRLGTTPESLAVDSLRERFASSTLSEVSPTNQATLADFLGEAIGSLHSSEIVPGGAQMSAGSGKKFAAGMLKKRQQRRL